MTDDFQNVGGIGITLGINDETEAKLQALEQRLGKIADAPRDVFVRFRDLGLKDIENKLTALEQKASQIGTGRTGNQSSPEEQVAASLKTTLDRFTSALTNFQVKLDPNSLSAITTAVRDGFSTQTTTDAVAARGGNLGFGTPTDPKYRRSDPVADGRRVASDSVIRGWNRDTYAAAIDKSRDRSSSRPPQAGKATPAQAKGGELSIDDFYAAFNRIAANAIKKPREPRVQEVLELVKKAPPEVRRQVMAPEGPYERYRAQEKGGFRGVGFGSPQQQEARAASSAQTTADARIPCDVCGRPILPRGMATHKRMAHKPVAEPTPPPAPAPRPARAERPAAGEGQWKGGVTPPEARDPEKDVGGQYLLQSDPRGRKTGRHRRANWKMYALAEDVASGEPFPVKAGIAEDVEGRGDIAARLGQAGRYQESVRFARRMLAQGQRQSFVESGATGPQHVEPVGGRRVAGTGKEYRGGEQALEGMGATLRSSGEIPAVFRRVLEEYKAGQIGTSFRLLTPEAVAAKVPGPSSQAAKTERMRNLLLRGDLLQSLLGPTFDTQIRQVSPTVQQGPLAGQGLMRVGVDEVIKRELVQRLGLESADALEKDPQLRQLMIELTDERQRYGQPRLRTPTEGMAMWQKPPSFAREEMATPIEFYNRQGQSRGRAMIRRDRARAMSVVGRTQRAQAYASRRRVHERLVGEGGQLQRGRFDKILTPRDLDYVEKTLQRQQEGKEVTWEDKAVTELMGMLDLYKLGPRDQRARAEDRALPEVSRSDINEFMYGKAIRPGESATDFAARGGIAEGETVAQYTKRGGMGLMGLLHPRFGRKSKDRRELGGLAARIFKAVGGEVRTVSGYRAEDERARQMQQERKDFPTPKYGARVLGLRPEDMELSEVTEYEGSARIRKLRQSIAIKDAEARNAQLTQPEQTISGADWWAGEDPGRAPKKALAVLPEPGFRNPFGKGDIVPRSHVTGPNFKRANAPALVPVQRELTAEERARSQADDEAALQEEISKLANLSDEAIQSYPRDVQRRVRGERAIARATLGVAKENEVEEASAASFRPAPVREEPAPPIVTVTPSPQVEPTPTVEATPAAVQAAYDAGNVEEGQRLQREVEAGGNEAAKATMAAAKAAMAEELRAGGSAGGGAGGGGFTGKITLDGQPIQVDVVKSVPIKIENPAVIKETVKAAEAKDKVEGAKTGKAEDAAEEATRQRARVERARSAAIKTSGREEVGRIEAEDKQEARAGQETTKQRGKVERARASAMKQAAREEMKRLEAEDTEPVRAYKALRSEMETEAKAEARAIAPGLAQRQRELAANKKAAERQSELERNLPVRRKLIEEEYNRYYPTAAESVSGLDDDPDRIARLRGFAEERGHSRYQDIVQRASEIYEEQQKRFEQPEYAWDATLNELTRLSETGVLPSGIFSGNEDRALRRDVERQMRPPEETVGEVQQSLLAGTAHAMRQAGFDVPKTLRGAPVGTTAQGIDYGTKTITKVDAAGAETEEEAPMTLADYMAQQKAAVTTAQRGLPVRALSTSMIQTFATAFGPYGRVQERAKLAESLGGTFRAEEKKLTALQQGRQALAPEAKLSATLAAVNAGTMAPSQALPKIEVLTDHIAKLDEEEQKQIETVKASKEAYDKQVASVVTASDQMQHFAATFAGGIAGGIVGSFAGMIAQPIMQAFTMAVEKIGGPMVDQYLGYSVTRQRTMGELAQGTEAAGGMGAVAFAQKYQFAPSAVTGQFASTMVPQAETMSAAKQFEAVRDMYRTAEGIGGGIPEALYTTKGPLGNPLLADYKSIAELVNSETFDWMNPDKANDWFGKVVNPILAETGQYEFRKGTNEELDAAAGAMGQMGLSDVRYAGFVAVDKASGDVADTFEELGRVLTDISDKFTRLDPEQLLDQMQPQMRAQTQQMEWQKNFSLDTLIPQQRGMSWLANPMMPYGSTWMPGQQANLAGQFSPEFSPYVAEAQAQLGSAPAGLGPMGINAKGQLDASKYSIPGAATQSFNQYEAVATQAFADVQRAAEAGIRALQDAGVPASTIESLRQYGAQAVAIQAQMAAIQSGRSETKYQRSLYMANRALTDARQLAGQIGRQAGSNVGYYERQLMLINRQNQALSLQLQKRQILTQLALARFQVPGETGEERYARRMEAEIAAGIQQKQLGLATSAFQTEIKLVDEQNLRAVRDAAYAIQEIKLDYKAQKAMEALQDTLAKVQAASQSLLPEAQVFVEFKNNYEQFMAGIAADIAAKTGENMTKVLDTVKEYITNDPVMSQILDIARRGGSDRSGANDSNRGRSSGANYGSAGGVTPSVTKTITSVDIKNGFNVTFNVKSMDQDQVNELVADLETKVVQSFNRIAQLIGLRPVAR